MDEKEGLAMQYDEDERHFRHPQVYIDNEFLDDIVMPNLTERLASSVS